MGEGQPLRGERISDIGEFAAARRFPLRAIDTGFATIVARRGHILGDGARGRDTDPGQRNHLPHVDRDADGGARRRGRGGPARRGIVVEQRFCTRRGGSDDVPILGRQDRRVARPRRGDGDGLNLAEQRDLADCRASGRFQDTQPQPPRGDGCGQADDALCADAFMLGERFPYAVHLGIDRETRDANAERQIFADTDQIEAARGR